MADTGPEQKKRTFLVVCRYGERSYLCRTRGSPLDWQDLLVDPDTLHDPLDVLELGGDGDPPKKVILFGWVGYDLVGNKLEPMGIARHPKTPLHIFQEFWNAKRKEFVDVE